MANSKATTEEKRPQMSEKEKKNFCSGFPPTIISEWESASYHREFPLHRVFLQRRLKLVFNTEKELEHVSIQCFLRSSYFN